MKRSSMLTSPIVWGWFLAACSAPAERAEHASPVPKTATSSKVTPLASAEVVPTPSASGSSTAATPQVDVAKEIAERTVGGTPKAHRFLYSWTTQKQLEELQNGSAFLSRDTSATRGPSAFDDFLSAEAARGSDVGKLLFSEGFKKKRFAWPSPFATITGEADGSYGDVLLEIELRDEAWILDYASGAVLGVDGSKGTVADAAKHPERIAAVFYLGDGYREFVVVNESMIRRWSAGAAPAVIRALRKDTEFLLAVADAIDDDKTKLPAMPSETEQLLHQTLAFARKLGVDELRSRAKLIDTIRSMARIAVEKEPSAPFVLGRQRLPLPPICKKVQSVSYKSQYIGSFAAPSRKPVASVLCEPAAPKVVCVTNQGQRPSDLVCTPLPVFSQ